MSSDLELFSIDCWLYLGRKRMARKRTRLRFEIMVRIIKTQHVLLLTFSLVLASHLSFAQGLTDTVMGLSSGGGLEAGSVRGPMPMSDIISKLQQQGYTNISDLSQSSSGSLLQATAITSTGTPVNLQIDPLTGSIVSALPK
jgi:hypothetical protein